MELIVTPTAEKQLAAILDTRIRQGIAQAIESLETEPDKKGKPLAGDLAGYRSIRAASQRYRVIYKIDDSVGVVTIVALGMRREGDRADIYALAKRLVRAGLFILSGLIILFCCI
ncbi:MAG TPA: type II toxin-antitoxin system RelE/ParE family toxin [Ktedonobacteraceae bacterium]|nr:type II toxin-antitoxin system RelE/ParE family toxin [Ktedonobacteraceae bacterium]